MAEGGVYAYIANGAKRVSVYSMSPDSKLEQLQDVAIYDNEIPEGVRAGRFTSIAVSPDRRFLYASNRTAPYSVQSFAIDQRTGLLTHLHESPLVDSAPFITTDQTGRYLLAAYNPPDRNRRTGFVSVSAIHEGFVQRPHQIIHTPPKTHAILPDLSNRFVFVPSCDGDIVLRFRFDEATGLLNSDGLSVLYTRPQAGPRHFGFHPTNRFMYLLNELDGTIYVYEFDPRDGSTSEVQIASVRNPGFDELENPDAGELHLTPSGHFLYAAVRATDTIAGFRIDDRTGLLELIGHFPVDKTPRGFAIEPLGRYLFSNALAGEHTTAYRIDPATGNLERLGDCPTLPDPNWMEFVRL